MANWRQIQVRIRKARSAADAPAQLTDLYEKTRDAMVAYELGVVQEKAGNAELAIGWFTIAAERFRRPEWRNKAAEALRRLGAPVPEPIVTSAPVGPLPEPGDAATAGDQPAPAPPPTKFAQPVEAQSSLPSEGGRATGSSAAPLRAPDEKRGRRGRRGGRGRRGRGRAGAATTEAKPAPPIAETHHAERASERRTEPRVVVPAPTQSGPATVSAEVEASSATPSWQARARAGDPAFASRLAQLEAQLRRLIVAPLFNMDELDQAPVGPGVFLVAESDQSAYYYVESCRTLRIAIAQIAKTERARGGEGSIRGRMAEHLGISESKVTKYLKDHCSVRWLQLDEGASHLAHFTIAVLKPALNE